MGYMCLECYEEYSGMALNLSVRDGYEHLCPKQGCNNMSVVEVDDLILPIIKILNQKGYVTTFCCSGHHYDYSPNTYIAFDEECVPSSIPNGFVVEDDKYYEDNHWKRCNSQICIRKKYSKELLSEGELHIEICKTMIELMQWAENLEEVEY